MNPWVTSGLDGSSTSMWGSCICHFKMSPVVGGLTSGIIRRTSSRTSRFSSSDACWNSSTNSTSSGEKCPRLCPWSEGHFSHILCFSTQNGEIRGTVNPCVGGSSPPGGADFETCGKTAIPVNKDSRERPFPAFFVFPPVFSLV